MENQPPATPPNQPPTEPPTQPPTGGQGGSFDRPAEYYAAPTAPQEKKGCPKWVPISCGLVGCLALVVIFGGGFFLLKGGLSKMVGFAFSRIQSDIDEMVSPEVTEKQKAELKKQMTELTDRIRRKEVHVSEVQPILTRLQEAISDKNLTPDEMDEMTNMIRELNEKPAATSSP